MRALKQQMRRKLRALKAKLAHLPGADGGADAAGAAGHGPAPEPAAALHPAVAEAARRLAAKRLASGSAGGGAGGRKAREAREEAGKERREEGEEKREAAREAAPPSTEGEAGQSAAEKDVLDIASRELRAAKAEKVQRRPATNCTAAQLVAAAARLRADCL